MPAEIETDWDLSTQDLEDLRKEYPMGDRYTSPMSQVWDTLSEKIDSKDIDLSGKDSEKAISDVCYNLIERYAMLQEHEFKEYGAEKHAAYAVHRMLKNIGKASDSGAIKNTMTSDSGFFKVTHGDEWELGGKTVKINVNNDGMWGTFGERALIGAGVGSWTSMDARLPDLMDTENLTLSAIEAKALTGKKVSVGSVTIAIDYEEDFNKKLDIAGKKAITMRPAERDALLDTVRKQNKSIRKEFAEYLEKNESVMNYIVARTIGVLKLFEKMSSALIFGVEKQKDGKKGRLFRYTSAKVYARLRYKEILKKLKESWGNEDGFGFIKVTVKWIHGKPSENLNYTEYANIELDVKIPPNQMELTSDGIKMSTALYKDVYDIFSNNAERLAFFKEMYKHQEKGDIATNIEVQTLMEQMKSVRKNI